MLPHTGNSRKKGMGIVKRKMWRKLLMGIAAAGMLISLAACGGDDGGAENQTTETTPVSESMPTGTYEAAEAASAPASADGVGTIGDFGVEITGAALAQDYEGNLAIVISYVWTNNSEDTTSPMAEVIESAFQDGIELETAFIADDEVYDSGSSMKEVRPGASLEVQAAYTLDSETSVVEFEIEEFLGFSDEKVSMNFDPAAL